MRIPKPLIAVLAIISLCIALYFSLLGSKTSTPEGSTPQPQLRSSLPDQTVTYKNKEYLSKKLTELDYWKQTNSETIEIIVSNVPQDTIVAQRLNDAGAVTVATSYSMMKSANASIYTLYVNPEFYPPEDSALLEQQYTQLLLVALYNTSPQEKPNSWKQNVQTFLGDYRQHKETNTIFSFQKK